MQHLAQSIVLITLLYVAPAAAASEWKGLISLNLAGGAGQTASPFKDGAVDPDVRSMTVGSGEFEFGATKMGDDGIASGGAWTVVLRSVAFGPARWEGSEQWDGGAIGVRGGYTYGRIETTLNVVAGSVAGGTPNGNGLDDGYRSNRSFVSPGIGLGLVLARSASFDLKLRAAYEPMFFDDRLTYVHADGSTMDFSDRLHAHHVGLALTFYPGMSKRPSGEPSFLGNCSYGCGRMIVEAGHLLVQVGSVVGRAAAGGLFRVLVR